MPSRLSTHPPLSSSEAGGSGGDGLSGVVRAAEALTIGRVEESAAITALDNVVSEHPMRWRCLVASTAAIYRFASIACPTINLITPDLILSRMQFGISLLGLRLDRPGVEHTYGRLHRMKLGHLCFLGIFPIAVKADPPHLGSMALPTLCGSATLSTRPEWNRLYRFTDLRKFEINRHCTAK